LRFDVITLFPELFGPHLIHGVTRRAFEARQVDVRLWPLRDFSDGHYRRVDDRPYGGGPGMVLMVRPLERALAAIRSSRSADEPDDAAPLIHFTPAGVRLDQALVTQFAGDRGGILLCGRYEGIDQRFLDRHVQLEVSLGDFVLSGGEIPAMALLDAVARLQDGVLGDAESSQQDSFCDGLLEGPHYSRPEVLQGEGGSMPIPPVLLSGNHGQIARWRREQSLLRTKSLRPDLIDSARARGLLSADDERLLGALDL
jgi:tRNA (guanine37-N1)-methyltransferase